MFALFVSPSVTVSRLASIFYFRLNLVGHFRQPLYLVRMETYVDLIAYRIPFASMDFSLPSLEQRQQMKRTNKIKKERE